MKKHLSMLMLLAALLVPWALKAQDAMSYTFATDVDSTMWVTLSSTATEVTDAYDDDETSGVLNIGFTFRFCGVDYTQWSCNSNGRIRLGSTGVSYYWSAPFLPDQLSGTSTNDCPQVAAFGTDNMVGETGTYIKYEVVGTAPNRMLVIEYSHHCTYDEDAPLVKYQVQLEEGTNVVRFVYGATDVTSSWTDGYGEFQAGMASASDDVVTVSSTHTIVTGATTTVRDAWPGVYRYYEFTPPTNYCARVAALATDTVGPDMATITWVDDVNSNWLVRLGTGDPETATNTSYTFNGLASNTEYTVSVAALCTGGDTSSWRSITFRTACGMITTMPYTDDFENDPYYSNVSYAEALPYCWHRINDATGTYNYYPYVNSSSTYVIHGTKSLYWYHSTSTTYANNQYAILPPVDLSVYDISDLTLAFWARTTATVSPWPQFIVGVMSDPTADSTFVPVDTITLTNAATMYVVSLVSYTGTGNYIAIRSPRTSTSSARYCSLDDIYLTNDWCNPPTSVTASSTTETVTVSWSSNGGTSFTVFLDDDTVANVTGNSYTFTGLTNNTNYVYGVANECTSSVSQFLTSSIRTLCDNLDTLPYTYGFEGLATGSSSVVPVIPCWHHLNNATQYFGWPYVSSTSHTGTRSLYWYAATTTGTYGDYQIMVLPGVDPDLYPINTLQLSFWARPSSAGYSPVFVVGVMTDPNNASTFQEVATVNVASTTTWQFFTVSLGTYTGNGNYVAVRMNRPSSSYYAYTDDFTLEPLPSCPTVINLEATATVGAAMLNWSYMAGYDAPASYIVTYDSVGGTNPTTVTVTETTAIITGLAAGTEYKVYVHADCGIDGMGANDSVTFTTGDFGCVEFDPASSFSDTINAGTATSTYFPSYSFYNYGLTQQIYTPTEMGHAMGISSISIKMSAVAQQRTFEIYMGHTSSATATAFINPSDLTCVYNGGPVTLTAGAWTTFNLTTTFSYNGSDNLVVFFRDMTGSYVSGNSCYGTTSGASNCSRYIYQDAGPYTIGSTTGGTASNFRPMLVFAGASCMTPATCAAPMVIITDKTTNTVTLSWIPGADETAWDVDYHALDTATWTNAATGTSNTTFTVTSLTPGTDYEFMVSHICSSGDTFYSVVTTRTPCLEISIPYSYGFEDLPTGSTSAHPDIPCWSHLNNGSTYFGYPYVTSTAHTGVRGLYWYLTTTTGSYGDYEIIVLPPVDTAINPINTLQLSFWAKPTSTSYSPVFLVGVMTDPDNPSTFQTVKTINVEHLTTNWKQYDAYLDTYTGTGRYVAIRANRPSSAWYAYLDDIVLDSMPTCKHVDNIHTTLNTGDSVMLVWTPGDEETEWHVTFGDTTVVTTEDSVLFTDLSSSTHYFGTITAICSSDDSSVAYPFHVMTACGKLSRMPYVQDFEYEQTTSSSNNNFVPCWHKLCNASSTFYPYVSNSTTYNHTSGGSNGLYWYSTNSSSYGTYQMIVLPEVDTVALPINTLKLSFWAKSTSTSYQPIFYVGVMTDPNVDSTFQYYDTINVGNNTSWQRFTTVFSNYADTGTYIAIRANAATTWTAYVDDITLDVIPACPSVEDVAVVPGTTSAVVNWSTYGNAYTGAVVEYKDTTAGSTWTSLNVTGDNYAVLTGLTASMMYDVRVTAVCTEDYGSAVLANFVTNSFGCGLADSSTYASGTIGTGTSQTTGVPVNSAWGNTLCQSIYLASELIALGFDTAGSSITDISYTWTNNSSYAKHFSIYMTNTVDSVFNGTGTNNWIPTGTSALVYSDEHPLNTSGTVTYHLATPFFWDGHSNLCITTTMNQPSNASHSSSGFYGLSTVTTANRSMYKYQDSSPLDGSNPASVTPSAMSTYRPNITLTSITCLQQTTCAAPVAYVTGVTTTTADVVWGPGNNDSVWNVYYRQASDANYTLAASGVTATNYTFTNLNPGTHYYFKVENTCGSETFGYEVDAYTECAAITLPFFEDFNSWGTGGIPNCWYRTGSYSTYTYISASYNMTGTSGGSIYMYSSTGTNYSTIVLPKLDTSLYQVNQTQLIFSALYTSTVYGRPKFEVGVLTDPENFNTFVPVDTVQHSGGITRWETFEVPLTSYTGNGAYVALRTVYDSNYSYPYLDDFTLELAPTCPRPDSLNATNATTNSVDLSWHERGGASQWIIEYGAWGFELGTGTQLVVNSNPFTLAGLPSAFRGEYYVKSICGIGDTGDFSRTSYRFETTQLPATIPYHYDFENAAEWANWSTSSNSTVYNWHRGTNVVDSGSYAMYVASSDSTYYSYTFDAITNVAAFRDIDFGTIDSSYTLTFRARAGGTINNYYDGLMVFLVDPAIPTVPSNTGITSPWGNVNDLYRIATMRVDTTWQTYTASFDTIHGVHRVAFFWFNQNTGASYANIPQAAAVDNIHIDYSPCPRPVNLDTMAVGGNSATLTWSGASSANYEVAYRVYGASAATTQFLYTTTNNASLSGLNATTQYIFWVRKLCGVGDSSLWSDGYVFETKLCDGGTFVLTGNPDSTSTTSYNAPVNNYYNYTLSETIFDSIELGGPMEISSIAYYYDYTTASTQKTDVTIWLQPTNKSSFSSTSDLILLDTTIAVQVYHGHLNCAQGWNYFGFATPYQYNGGNLVVIVDDNSGAYNSSTYVFKTVACSTTRTLTWYSNSYNPDPTSTSFSGSKTSYQWRPVMQLISCGGGCSAPLTSVTQHDYQSATIQVTGSSNSYELEYGTDPSNLGNLLTSSTGTFSISGLQPTTTYYYHARKSCEDNQMSPWASGFFTTDDLPCLPVTNLHVAGTGYSSVDLTWTAGSDETAWEVKVYNNIDTVSMTTALASATVTGLMAQTGYYANVRPLCGDAAEVPGPWSDSAVYFTTDLCQPVTNVTVTPGATSATVAWTAPSGATNFRVAYGPEGFPVGGETGIYNVTSNPFELTDLEPETPYTVQVANVCSDDLVSAWARADFLTLSGDGIADIDGEGNISLFPNPASTTVTIGLAEVSDLTIVDLNGREVFRANAVSSATIDVSTYAKGAYFVRVVNESGTSVRKLVVK